MARQARYSQTSTPVAGYYGNGGYNPIITESAYSVPVYTVPADQPTVPVVAVTGAATPADTSWACGLQSALSAVPLPTGITQLQANGGDGHLAIWQPATDTMWEFWKFRNTGTASAPHFTAGYGGRN